MQSGTQSNRAPGPRGACRACPREPPAGWNAAGFRPGGAERNPASRRFRALHPQPKRLAPSIPDASQTKLRAARDHLDRRPARLRGQNGRPLGRQYAGSNQRRKQSRGPTLRLRPASGLHIRGRFPSLTQRREPRCGQRNKSPLSARSNLFLCNHNPRPGLFICRKIGGHRKAAGPNEDSVTGQHRPALPLPAADVLFVP